MSDHSPTNTDQRFDAPERARGETRGDSEPIAGKPSPGDRLDATFAALETPERRAVVAYLRTVGEPVSVSELGLALATRLGTSRDPDQLEVTLVHAILPALADLGAIEYDGGEVRFDGDEVRFDGGEALDRVLAEFVVDR